MRILIIKLTSMGDLMHAFPAITDACAAIPDLEVDWVVDESFSEIPLWHPAVKRVIKTSHRRWKKSFWRSLKHGEFSSFYNELNQKTYDVVVDLQSNLKSSLVSWLRRSPVCGYDRETCREKPAHWAYAKHFNIGLEQHAIDRQRQIMAKVLNYSLPSTSPDYGVELVDSFKLDFDLPENFLVFVHNASWQTKLWPEEYWRSLIKRATDQGYSILLPSGDADEYTRALRLAEGYSEAIALPKMNLNATSSVIRLAKAAVCSDTGLAHMSALLSTPAITLYAVTRTLLIGTVGQNQHHIVADNSMGEISVDQVWRELSSLLEKN